ncbi:MAG: alpha-L-fucosidase [Draconibacterium sp.]|nr:alpha-L-fucosidase [Draconibacterium sp.]
MKKIIIILFLFFIVLSAFSQKYENNWESINSRPIPEWFTDAKFGIFIHWGIYAVPAWAPANADIGVYAKYSEWYWWRINEDSKAGKIFRDYHNKMYGEDFLYQDFANKFKAEHWNPEQWANVFKKSGAKYIVLTSKHHEGFTLWPSEQSWNWNSVDIGPHRDLCGDLSKAVKDVGLRMGFYYSLYEWYNPLYHNNLEKYVDDLMIPQMKDLVTSYEPDILWTDGEWDHTSEKWKSTEFLSWLYNESPVKEQICVNDRWGKETRGKLGGYFTTEYDLVHENEGIGKTDRPWEECRGIGTSFGYNQMENLGNYMSSDALIDMLIEKVATGGNLLLDIGPTADGRIPVIQQQRLLDIGAWLDINGEAIYETRQWKGSGMNQQDNIFFTKKGADLYVHCTKFPATAIEIKGIKSNAKVSMLGVESEVGVKKSGNSFKIIVPNISPLNNPSEFAWVFKIEGAL